MTSVASLFRTSLPWMAVVCALAAGCTPVAKGGFCHGEEDGTRCDDANGCTVDDVCGGGECRGRPVDDGLECNDNRLCTSNDVCRAGTCTGDVRDCSTLDGACTEGVCNEQTGACGTQPAHEGEACTFAGLCDINKTCHDGACLGEPKVCTTSNVCMVAVCDPGTGQCMEVPLTNGTPCSDGNNCTVGDACDDGTCVGLTTDCRSLDSACSSGVCNQVTGACERDLRPNGSTCDDQNDCTQGETCNAGECNGGLSRPEGSACDDGSLCTLNDTCVAGSCVGETRSCGPANPNPCIATSCNPDTGECIARQVVSPFCSCFGLPNGTPCDDGLTCTAGDVCREGTCQGAPRDCTALNGECAVGVCNEETGLCEPSPAREGSACSDGSRCTENDVCRGGLCAGQPLDCSSLSGECARGVCREDIGECTRAAMPNGTACDDGDRCTSNDACSNGQCAGSFNVCDACAGKSAGDACDDGDLCTVSTTCAAGPDGLACSGPLTSCASLDGPCVFGSCDRETGGCVVNNVPDGVLCNDGEACTLQDRCVAGTCTGTPLLCDAYDSACAEGICSPNTGRCVRRNLADNTVCDDGARCTENDACRQGRCEGLTRDCSSAQNQCQVGLCDPASGDCGVPVTNGTVCDDGDACTQQDACFRGECTGVNVCFCQQNPAGTACDDRQPCTIDDACANGACAGTPRDCSQLSGVCMVGECDALTGDCRARPADDGTTCDDGNPCTTQDRCSAGGCTGTPVSCSQLDSACGAGTCDRSSGACVVAPFAEGTPCNDGDSCTGGDHCTGGVCGGAIDTCGVCNGLNAGDSCDDGDPCTDNTTCVQQGASLGCAGTQKSCAASDTACRVGVCNRGTGACETVTRADGTSCDDANACTEADRCTGGACGGTAIDMCGATVTSCEGPAANDDSSLAAPLNRQDFPITVMARLRPAGEADWFTVHVLAGELLNVETRPHCSSVLDMQLAVYQPGGAVLFAEDDDSGTGAFARITNLEIPYEGDWLIGVSAYAASGTGSYLLDVRAGLPPPCSSDMDCGCGDLRCEMGGANAGRCLPRMADEVEPNDTPTSASALAVDGEVRGELTTPTDEDWFRVDLQAAVPVTVQTRAFCGGAGDPQLAVYDAEGAMLLAQDHDGAADGHARLASFTAPRDGSYRIQVRAQAAQTGRFVLGVTDARCRSDSACACEDQRCTGDSTTPGMCVPRVDGDGSVTPVPLTLGQRMHGAVEQPYAHDTFTVELAVGAYSIQTVPYCGTDMDTVIVVEGPSGTTPATDDDSGEGFHAALPNFQATIPGTYRIMVSANGPAVGDYVVLAAAR